LSELYPYSVWRKQTYPRIRIQWLRDGEEIDFERPLRGLAMGIQGSAKSSLLEVCGVNYPKIIDILGSRDGEALCWCKPEYETYFQAAHNRKPNILLITGEGVKVASKQDSVNIKDLKLKTFQEPYDVITTAQMLHQTEKEYYGTMNRIIDIIEGRLYWDEPWYLMIREAANWAYARLRVVKDQEAAKSDLIKFFREGRHHGVAIFMDTLRWTNIDKEIRDLSDLLFIKKLGDQGLPRDLRYCYRYWTPKSLRWLSKNRFGIKSVSGSIGVGIFDRPTWHKEEKENILKSTQIEIKYEQKEDTEERRYGVGDFQHAEIIEKYIETKSMHKTAADLSRSSATVKAHIASHNLSVKRLGECDKCMNAKSQFSKDPIVRPAPSEQG
jgi:hypothetical protein